MIIKLKDMFRQKYFVALMFVWVETSSNLSLVFSYCYETEKERLWKVKESIVEREK